MKSLSFVAALLGLLAPFRIDAQSNFPYSAGAKITLSTAQPEYLLGENVIVNYILENTGDKPFQADFGGDYRGCDRSLRFLVTLKDETGALAPSADPEPMCMGGLSAGITVAPGEKRYNSIALSRYRQIDKPGTYTITIWHDLGWKPETGRPPAGQMTLRFHMPTSEEAEAVVEHMEKMPDDAPDGMMGGNKEPGGDYADFRCFRYLVYLPPLLSRAKTGDARALEGVGSIPFPEATAALIDLANSPDPKLSLDAVHTLSLRLPDPEFDGKLHPRGPFNLYGTAKRKALAARSWDPKFAAPIRELALKFMARPDTDGITAGAFMFQSVGTAEDAPAVFKALELALNPTSQPRRDPKGDVLDFPPAVMELLRATKMLYDRGYDDKGSPSGEAQFLAYFQQCQSDQPARPHNFLNMVTNFGIASNRYPTRQTTLLALPQPLPDEYVPVVKLGLDDRDYGVLRVACDVAEKSGRKEFLKPILAIIQTENEEWLMRSAMSSALALGGGADALNACADKLVDEDLYPIALDSLQTVISGLPGGYGGRTDLTREERLALRDAWKNFIKEHETELSAGAKFKVGDPAITAALFGRARSFILPDGKTWPPAGP